MCEKQERWEYNSSWCKKVGTRERVAEISKYSAKDSDYLITQDVFDVMYKALKGRQIITYNGVFKESTKLYKKEI